MRVLLDECLALRRYIKQTDEKIAEIEAVLYSPKNQIISDMPKGGGSSNDKVDKLLEKIAKLQRNRERAVRELTNKWLLVIEQLKKCEATESEMQMLKLRFFNALSWKQCARTLDQSIPSEKWDENRCFRCYRKIIKKCTKIT